MTDNGHMAMPVILEVEGLQVTYATPEGPLRAISDLSFVTHRSEAVGIVGESGSGKSTALRAILGLLSSNAAIVGGRILLNGEDLLADKAATARARGRSVTMIFQDPINSLNPSLSLGWQLGRLLKMEQPELTRREREATLLDILQRVGIDGRQKLRSYPFEFSQGQLQRAVIAACCLIRRPQVLLADEPTTSLDVTVEAQILDLLHELREELGLTVIFVTHDLALISEFCDRALVMYAGRLVEQGSAADLLDRPKHPYTRRLLESLPVFPGSGGDLATIPGEVPNLARLQPGCAFAPRCPAHLGEICDRTSPATRPTEQPGQEVACHLYKPALVPDGSELGGSDDH